MNHSLDDSDVDDSDDDDSLDFWIFCHIFTNHVGYRSSIILIFVIHGRCWCSSESCGGCRDSSCSVVVMDDVGGDCNNGSFSTCNDVISPSSDNNNPVVEF